MHFDENPYFNNPILELDLKQDGPNALSRKLTYPIEYKAENKDQSFFTIIFRMPIQMTL